MRRVIVARVAVSGIMVAGENVSGTAVDTNAAKKTVCLTTADNRIGRSHYRGGNGHVHCVRDHSGIQKAGARAS